MTTGWTTYDGLTTTTITYLALGRPAINMGDQKKSLAVLQITAQV